jgi:hypothetical protein
MEEYNKDTHLYNNTNCLFEEDKFLAHTSFIAKKGTETGIRYMARNAHDAQLQGVNVISNQDFFVNIESLEPFSYRVESNILPIIFEKFIKPLAHPIGMVYSYSAVCQDLIASRTETPLIRYVYEDLTLSVNCLCYSVGQEDTALPIEPEDIQCVYNTQEQDYPEPKVFASPNGLGLWEPISKHYNILDDIEEGYAVIGDYAGSHYVRYIMKNGNYLVKYIRKPDINNTSEKIDILYYTTKPGGYVLNAKFINRRHCDIRFDKDPEKRSVIKDDISSKCDLTYNGVFQYLMENENTQPDQPAPPHPPSITSFYEGFLITSEEWGGLLARWTDLYYGWFRFNDVDEDPLAETWDEDGFLSGFGKSVLYTSNPEAKDSPQEAMAMLERNDYNFLDLKLEDII